MFDRWIFTAPTPQPDVRIEYGDNPFQFAELRLPKEDDRKSNPLPVVLGVHGGYWMAQFGLEYFTHLCADLTDRGVATYCIEYRRLGNRGGGWPGTFLDVAASADHLRVVAGDYNLDLNRVTVIGHSAGGHLGLWLAARSRIPSQSAVYSCDPLKIHKVVSLAGVNDLLECWEKRLCENVVEHFLAGSPDTQPDRYQAASPAALLPLGVKQILFHGGNDTLVPTSLSESYWRAATEKGDDCTLEVLSGAGHFEVVDPKSPEWRPICEAVLADQGLDPVRSKVR